MSDSFAGKAEKTKEKRFSVRELRETKRKWREEESSLVGVRELCLSRLSSVESSAFLLESRSSSRVDSAVDSST